MNELINNLREENEQLKLALEKAEAERDDYSQAAGVALDAAGYPLQKRAHFKADEYRAHISERDTKQQIKVLKVVMRENSGDAFSNSVAVDICNRKIEQLRKELE